jgi:hypothetical protein
VVDRIGQAGIHTLVALGAEPALEATIGFGLGLLLVIAEGDLQKIALPGLGIEAPTVVRFLLGSWLDIGFDEIPFFCRPSARSMPLMKRWILSAASLPQATASTTDLGP